MKKFTADTIFDGEKILPPNTVILCHESGRIEAITTETEAGEGVVHCNGWITPGFINCHCHLELSHLEGIITEHTGLVNFVSLLMQERNKHAVTNEKMQLLISKMKEEGTVAVGDICNTTDSISAKINSDLYFHNFVEIAGFVPAGVSGRIEAAEKLSNSFLENGLSHTSIAAHATYSVSDELFQEINKKTKNAVTSLHNQEAADENLFFQEKTGSFCELYKMLGIDIDFYRHPSLSALQRSLPFYTENQKLLLVHNSFTKEEDIVFAKKYASQFLKDLYFVVCHRANLYIENTLPPLDLLQKHGVSICLGTDSLASNNDLSLVNEMVSLQQHFPSLKLTDILYWATAGGAKALEISEKYGRIAKGMQPGLVHMENIVEGKFSVATTARRIV